MAKVLASVEMDTKRRETLLLYIVMKFFWTLQWCRTYIFPVSICRRDSFVRVVYSVFACLYCMRFWRTSYKKGSFFTNVKECAYRSCFFTVYLLTSFELLFFYLLLIFWRCKPVPSIWIKWPGRRKSAKLNAFSGHKTLEQIVYTKD